MWLALAERLRKGEALYSNRHFRVALLEIYEQVTGQPPPSQVEDEVWEMVETVNRDHPETYLAQAVQNGIAKAFEEGVRQQNWDLAKIQEQGARALKRFSQQESVRELLEDAQISPSQLSIVSCLQKVIDQVSPRMQATATSQASAPPAFRPDLAAPEPVAKPTEQVPETPADADMEAAIASGEVDADVARERAETGEKRRIVMEAEEFEKVPERLDSLVQQGVVTEDEASKLRDLHSVNQRVKDGEITETEATEIRNSLLNPSVRDKLERKVREVVEKEVRRDFDPHFETSFDDIVRCHKRVIESEGEARLAHGRLMEAHRAVRSWHQNPSMT